MKIVKGEGLNFGSPWLNKPPRKPTTKPTTKKETK